MKTIKKKVGILLVIAIYLCCLTSCFFSVPIANNKVEPVGDIPAFYEKELAEDEILYYGTQIGNIVLYDSSNWGKIRITAYDFSTESTKNLNYDYSSSTYYLDHLVAAKDGNFYMLFTPNSYEEDVFAMVVKSDLEGNVIWETQLQNANVYVLNALAEAVNGDVYVVGYTSQEADSRGQGQSGELLSNTGFLDETIEDASYDEDAYVAKIDAQGNRIGEICLTDGTNNTYFFDATYVENVGLIAAYSTYNADYSEKISVICLDENCKQVWQADIAEDATGMYTYLGVIEQQIYCYTWMLNECRISTLDSKGNIQWTQEFQDDTDVVLLIETRESQAIVSRTDECFTLNAHDGSIDQYLYEDEVGIIYGIYYFDDYYVVLSDHLCGKKYGVSGIDGDLYEQVYSGYDYDGNLLWRKGFTYG